MKGTSYSKVEAKGRKSGGTPRPKVDPQFSPFSKGVTHASGGKKTGSPTVGYHRAEC